ncbi:MAG TPA: hypothetical protein VES95_01240 [Dermatophilaceae bacterium]|nr:hypothetical protein [Dermatophilaceae bacterium]
MRIPQRREQRRAARRTAESQVGREPERHTHWHWGVVAASGFSKEPPRR